MSRQEIEKPIEIKIELPTNAYFMSGIRDFTLSMIRNMTDFSEQWAYRFQSVVDEICNNAIEHGSSKDDSIYITFITHPNQDIEIVVEDNGSNPESLPAAEILKKIENNAKLEINEIGIRGRGLAFIVQEWTDKLEITDRENGGIRVRVVKNMNDPKFKEDTESNDPTKIILTN
jgi:anti-sigma regulatory factor (Ser/Thr protein kinase)